MIRVGMNWKWDNGHLNMISDLKVFLFVVHMTNLYVPQNTKV